MLKTDLPFSLYVIESDNGRRYIGISSDIKARIRAHNEGKSRWTRSYKNWKLIYKEDFSDTEARRRELYLKRQKGGNGLLKIIYSGVEQSGSSRGS